MSQSQRKLRHRPHGNRGFMDMDINGKAQSISLSSSPSSSRRSSLSGNDDDRAAADGCEAVNGLHGPGQKKNRRHGYERREEEQPMEWGNMALLVLLYAMQGVPLGLTMGALPFMLQSKVTLTQMGIFSMASYPYSFKLFWSPIVDSIYFKSFGLRKSWIVPIQLASAALLIARAGWIEEHFEAGDVVSLTALFFVFVLLAATQDIAVDGWALTLLPKAHIEYASTCQTLGMNTGFFTSFTIFLAFSNPEFCNKYVRSNQLLRDAGLVSEPSSVGLVTLKGYLTFWGWAFALVTLAIAVLKPEGRADEEELEGGGDDYSNQCQASPYDSIVSAYKQLWGVMKLKPIWVLSLLLVTYRLGVLPAESTASLKLLDNGVGKETLAALVLMQFPVELVSAVVAGRWASSHAPYHPFMAGYFIRLLLALSATRLAAAFPPGVSSFQEGGPWFAALMGLGLATSFTSTLMFTALGSFYNKISDPVMGGAYLTLLNTIANMGVILPKTPLYAVMDKLTISTCRSKGGDGGGGGEVMVGLACPKKLRELEGRNPCTDAGGVCSLDQDGFYYISYTMIVMGLLVGLWLMRVFPRLEKLPLSRWRARPTSSSGSSENAAAQAAARSKGE